MTHDSQEGSALTTHRVEALQDGVFAIVMTLLILELRSPEVEGQDALVRSLVALWPVVFSYVVTFLNLGVYWVGQHAQFYYIVATDRILLWINLLFLMLVSVLPFTTALLGRYGGLQLPYVLYGIHIILIGIVSWWHWRYATQHHRLTTHTLSKDVIRTVTRRILVAPCVSVVAIFSSFLYPMLSLFFYLLLPLYYMRPGQVDAVWRRAAVAHDH